MNNYYRNRAVAVGWVNFLLIDHRGRFASGGKTLKLWTFSSSQIIEQQQNGGSNKANPIGTCVDNLAATNPILLSVEFER